MKFSVTVRNAETRSGIPDAKIVLYVDDEERVTLFTDGAGQAEHIERSRMVVNTLSWTAEAKGFEVGTGRVDINREDQTVNVFLVQEVEVLASAPLEESPVPPQEAEAVKLVFLVVDESGKPLDGAELVLEYGERQVGYGISAKGVVTPSERVVGLKRGEPIAYRIDKKGFETKSGIFSLGDEGGVQQVTLVKVVGEDIPLRRFFKFSAVLGALATGLVVYNFLFVAAGPLPVLKIFIALPWFGLTLWALSRAKVAEENESLRGILTLATLNGALFTAMLIYGYLFKQNLSKDLHLLEILITLPWFGLTFWTRFQAHKQ